MSIQRNMSPPILSVTPKSRNTFNVKWSAIEKMGNNKNILSEITCPLLEPLLILLKNEVQARGFKRRLLSAY